MAAVRAKTMHATTKSKILNDGQPFAATTSAPRANGSAKIVCEKRINRRNRAIEPSPSRLISVAERFLTEGNEENEDCNFAQTFRYLRFLLLIRYVRIQRSLSSKPRSRSLARDKMGVPCAKSIRSAL